MAEPQYAHNHTIDPETGFLENNGYGYPFDAARKTEFIETFVNHGLSLYNTCKALGISHHTIFNHLRKDATFKSALEEARAQYADELDGISKQNARNPRSVIERIFQLKSLFPERYADQRNTQPQTITIHIDSELISEARKRSEVLEAQVISEISALTSTPTENTQDNDIQPLLSARNSEAGA